MENDRKSLLGNFAGIAVTTGLAAITQGSSHLMLGLVGNIATGLASSFIEKTEYRKIKAILGETDPSEYNHDLKKLIIHAVEWAFKNIEILYKKNLTEKHQIRQLREFTGDLQEQVSILSGVILKKDSQWLEMMDHSKNGDTVLQAFQISVDTFPVINEQLPFADFFRDQFIPNLQLCFGELLKSASNRPAYIAYQRQIYDTIQQRIDKVLEQNEKILQHLQPNTGDDVAVTPLLRTVQQKIRMVSRKGKERYMDKALGDYLAPLQQKIELLVDYTIGISQDVKEIKSLTHGLDKKLSENWISKHKLLVFLLAVILVTVIAGMFIYFQHRPFNATLSLVPEPIIKVHPNYPPVNRPTKLTLELPDEKITRETNSSLEVLLPELPHNVKNQATKIYLDDPYWELSVDSARMSKNLTLSIRPNAKLARIQGVVRDWDGNKFITHARLQIPGDTILYTDSNGVFDAILPIPFRRPEYRIIISAPGYETLDESRYYPGTPVEFRMKQIK